jgi:hypothetical protein
MRNLTVLLSLAVVVACPYVCTVRLAAAHAIGSSAKPACCEHCESHRPAPMGDPTPHAPSSSEDGRLCLCGGAVFDAGVRLAVDDSAQVTLWVGTAGAAESSAISIPARRLERSTSPPTVDGRLMRIAICSLLL